MNSKAILSVIRKNNVFLLTTHVNADFDALSSQLALAIFLKSRQKKVYLMNADKPLLMHRLLPCVRSVKEFKNQKIDYDAAIVLDCGDLGRIGKVKKLIQKDKPLVNIDHHVTNDFFGSVNLVKKNASSTAEIIYDLLAQAKEKLTKDMAVLLYAGIMTDTGSFRFENTTSHTHEVVGQLMRFKFSVSKLYSQIYEVVPLKDLNLFASLMGNFKISHDGKVASIELPKRIVDQFSGTFDLREKIFSFLRTIKGVEVVAILTQHQKKSTRINFRSQGKVDVAKLASLYQGGGHKRASGCWINSPVKEAKKEIFSRLSKIL